MEFSSDGLTVFTANRANSSRVMASDSPLRMNKVAVPFKVTSDLMN